MWNLCLACYCLQICAVEQASASALCVSSLFTSALCVSEACAALALPLWLVVYNTMDAESCYCSTSVCRPVHLGLLPGRA
jgi:hypothetical protein